MSLNDKVGIIGKGFVGNAVYRSYDPSYEEVVFYDPHKDGSVPMLLDLMDCDVLYVCVPTPPNDAGGDFSILEKTLADLVTFRYDGPVICKSTAPAWVYRKYAHKLKIIFIPEFLRADSAVDDYRDTEYLVVGIGNLDEAEEYKKIVEEIFSATFLNISNAHLCTIEEACLVKYFENSFLAVKVSLMNEFHQLVTHADLNWDRIIKALTEDWRINPDHTQVPGPDGKFGWGGHCFPKDTAALVHLAREQHLLGLPVLEAAIKSNEYFRNEYDGEK